MSEHQIKLVQSTWQMIVPVKDQTAELFYRKLFLIAPEVRPLFKGDIKEQGTKLVNSINLVVNSLTHLEQVVPALQELGRRHIDYGVEADHYDIVAEALLWTLEQGLGEDFTDEVKEAWTIAYTIIATTMIEASTNN
ncbi:MAG: hemin receptor [Gammaproteobacteria bacterium]|nr:MAG: hemin receptor [Gammaproteobacteria bacterium]